jgi:Sec-independent protein translocase protein TatA
MFGISMEELLVLAVLAFILFGPQKLPEYAEKLGRIVAKVRAASAEATQQFQNPFQYPQEPGNAGPALPEPGQPPRSRQATAFKTCPSCHETLNRSFTFCPCCGQRVTEAAPQEPQQPLAS